MTFLLLFKTNFANLKSCSEIIDKLEICFKGQKYYKNPLPVVVRSYLHLNKIIEINGDKNSVSVQLYLWMGWHDSLLFLSNNFTAV